MDQLDSINDDNKTGAVIGQEENDLPELLTALDPVAEKKLLRKMDLHVVVPVSILFLLNFLDRTNIGNAKIQGLVQDLKMTGSDYNVALMIFFVPYILFEVPSNVIIKRVAPSSWLCGIMFMWGIVTLAQGFVKSFGSFVGLRFLVGLFEAGFSPGCVYLISMYYKRYELQWRLSIFFSASILAGAFGGLFAYALSQMAGISGYNGWRWIFIIEGLVTVLFAMAFKFVVVDWPETAKFLTPTERTMVIQRLAADTGMAKMDTLDGRAARRIFSDWKIYCGTFMYMGVVTTGNANIFFITTIIKEMGFTSTASQIRSIPIFLSSALTGLIAAYFADRLRHRYTFTMLGIVVAAVGYIILFNQDKVSVGVEYFACFLITNGGFISQPVIWTWLNNNVSGHYKRSVSVAVQIGFGNVGGIVASNIFITSQSPRYPVGYGVSLGMLIMSGVLCTVFVFGLQMENRKRDRGGRDYRYAEGEEALANMGDDHPDFRFTY
ncbi:hypothetical protein BP6252_05973 [Coleophoma cylindrospora]|uniref:Major facilitator superfamily (MFS) profile domain-containing protein n=1 Tax=Coleophoma cylindrospora TaxID=1849047 RepID=A0A3D8RM08_9HELO|nr:hypothetical protein BP6252_05973 [Coleophoma cylindrospora]